MGFVSGIFSLEIHAFILTIVVKPMNGFLVLSIPGGGNHDFELVVLVPRLD